MKNVFIVEAKLGLSEVYRKVIIGFFVGLT